MRGKEKPVCCTPDQNGITPAYAGKRLHSEIYGRKYKDHPRLCGEKRQLVLVLFPRLGSPPPMRGKVSHSANSGFPVRITPAYAGKSQAGSLSHKRIEDHPRLCGEKSFCTTR